MPWFIIGELHDPIPEDRCRLYDTEQEAIEAASRRAECDPKACIAVWDNEDRPLWLFTGGEQWRRV